MMCSSGDSNLVSGFSEKLEHFFLIDFDARLIKRVDLVQVTGNRACVFEEVNQYAKMIFIEFREIDSHIRASAIRMRLASRFLRDTVDFRKLAPLKVIKFVD